MPLYIGDWLQDMDAVSLECESAWLRIVFKMFKDNKSGVYKTNAKGLQRLWKCDANTMQNILEELALEGIGEVTEENGLYTFKNRRMLKDQEVSTKRKEAAKKRWNKDKTECKTDTKDIQSPENEIEYENEIDLELNEKSIQEARIIAEFFSIREVAQHKRFVVIAEFCKWAIQNDKIEEVRKQFKAYTRFKAKSKQAIHNVKSFIGNPPEYNGAWNECDWTDKLKSLSNVTPNKTPFHKN